MVIPDDILFITIHKMYMDVSHSVFVQCTVK